MRLEQLQARGVVPVTAIDVGVEGPGIDDQRDGWTSLARISSIRSEMSSRPLAPAPAARSRRLPWWAPSRFSIASRVSADTVLPRRWASWRRRASSSSDSFTVVLCMYASIQRNSIVEPLSRHLGDERQASAASICRQCVTGNKCPSPGRIVNVEPWIPSARHSVSACGTMASPSPHHR